MQRLDVEEILEPSLGLGPVEEITDSA